MSKINAFILAAGYGERLKPITDFIPKPLLPICGKPVIEIVLDKIAALSPHAIGINTHHKPGQIEKWKNELSTYCNITLFHENSILGTGGALKNAESILRDSTFIVHNADILTDFDLESLVKNHHESGNIATLAVHNHEKFNNVWIDGRGNLKSVGRTTEEGTGLCKIAFMGVAVYSQKILQYLPEGNSSVVDAWLRATAEGHVIGTVNYSGSSWTDIGTPDAYAAAVFDTLRKNGEMIYVNAAVDCSKADLTGNVVIEEGVSVEAQSCMANSILLQGTRITSHTKIENAIVGPEFLVPIRAGINRKEMQLGPLIRQWLKRAEGAAIADMIGTGGSDRTYYRISRNNRTAVLMYCRENDQDYSRHIAYTRFFRTCSLPVPDILIVDEDNKQALFEDLGDLSLYSWLKCRRSPKEVESMYKNTLDIVVQLQTRAADHLSECPMLQERVFDYDHLRWETSYFLERFINGIYKLNNSDPELQAEFHRLAKEVEAFSKTVLHRDFQSQNIMVTKGGIPRLIDYQGARLGPAAYDIASILWDPYYRMEDGLRDRLIEYFVTCMKQYQPSFNRPAFDRSLLLCRLQRHMQALGAYAFLSTEKKKSYFLKYIPQAVDYLKQETAASKENFPALHALIEGLR